MRKYDLTGKTFGCLTVVGLSDVQKHHTFQWNCKCKCGKSIFAGTQLLMKGRKKSCGCTKINLIGRKIHQLEVICEAGTDKHNQRLWKCQCECGGTTILPTAVLTKGRTRSCGCIHWNRGSKHHQWRGHGEISSCMWKQIQSSAKCRDLGIQITLEEIWELFIRQNKKCAMSGLPLTFGEKKKGVTASLDRIDSSLGYTIENVQWVHKDINRMKSDFDQEYFVLLCRAVAKNNSNSG